MTFHVIRLPPSILYLNSVQNLTNFFFNTKQSKQKPFTEMFLELHILFAYFISMYYFIIHTYKKFEFSSTQSTCFCFFNRRIALIHQFLFGEFNVY